MINRTVLVSDTRHFSIDTPINPYYHFDDTLDSQRAADEHQQIRQALEQAGVTVIQRESAKHSQDGVYTANQALVRGDTAVLARLPAVRRTEEAHARQLLEELGKRVVIVPEDWHFSGQGDALACGNYLFCGSTYRSDARAQAFAAETLGYERVQLRTVPQYDDNGTEVVNAASGWPDSFFYDIDLALSVLKGPENGQKGLIAYCPDAFTPESRQLLEEFDGVEKITVSLQEAQEAFACNLVSTGETVVMSNRAPVFAAALHQHGLQTLHPDVSELAKGGGYIRCTTLTLD